jgi:hypothetical protein
MHYIQRTTLPTSWIHDVVQTSHTVIREQLRTTTYMNLYAPEGGFVTLKPVVLII